LVFASAASERPDEACGDAAPEPVLVGYDKESQELLMIQPLEELEDDLDLRMSLLRK
jgi:hypothetical protein